MKNLLKYVPGFRSSNKKNIFIASIYYAICIYNLPTLNYLPFALIMIVIPFIFFYIKDVRKKEENVPVVKTPVQLTKFVTISIIVCVSIFFSFGTYMRTIENAKMNVKNAQMAKANAIQEKINTKIRAENKQVAAAAAVTAQQKADDAAAAQQSADDAAAAQAKVDAATSDPTVGMTAEQVKGSAWGSPDSINKTTTQDDEEEQWVYGENRYVYLDNGIVTTIQQ